MVRETVSMEGHLIDSDILRKAFDRIVEAVSYTHLTLPTKA